MMVARKNPGPGRPPKHGGKAMRFAPLALRLPDAMIAEIDAIAAGRLDQPDRSSVIRELLAEAIGARNKSRRPTR
jgi:metal-responsive CopG/Arc/MetJ family transcriptional regulator